MVPSVGSTLTGWFWKIFAAYPEVQVIANGRTTPDGWFTGIRP
jgi:hypothetical protein